MLKRRRAAIAALCLAASLASAPAANIPRHSPEFAVNLTGGKQLLLSSYKGKAIALIFILTYCPHCQKTVGMLSKMQNEYGPRGFQALGSAIEDMAAMAVPKFIRDFNPPFPIGFNDRNQVLDYLQHPVMARLLMPQLVFIDKSFTIRSQYSGDDKFFGDDQEKNIRAEIEKMLKEPAPSAAPKKGSPATRRKKTTT
jgi:thiol-disulfide isomerase/thioredoxin